MDAEVRHLNRQPEPLRLRRVQRKLHTSILQQAIPPAEKHGGRDGGPQALQHRPPKACLRVQAPPRSTLKAPMHGAAFELLPTRQPRTSDHCCDKLPTANWALPPASRPAGMPSQSKRKRSTHKAHKARCGCTALQWSGGNVSGTLYCGIAGRGELEVGMPRWRYDAQPLLRYATVAEAPLYREIMEVFATQRPATRAGSRRRTSTRRCSHALDPVPGNPPRTSRASPR
jgi:hypothetical protein